MKKKRKRRPAARSRNVRAGLNRLVSVLAVALVTFGGVDYYQNKNLDHTARLLAQVEETGRFVSGGARELVNWADNVAKGWINGKETADSQAFPEQIPEYAGEPYVVLADNEPDFTNEELCADAFEHYSDLDALGRCGTAEAMIGTELMPTEERGPIGAVRPSGWHTVKYTCIDDLYLYNRCHLIAFALTGENANEQNLITGTRYMNVEGMLPWEAKVIQYIRQTGDKVRYRVTPVYRGADLVARGVRMEAQSVGSQEIKFNIFVYNVQPGVGIDYSNGDSWELSEGTR